MLDTYDTFSQSVFSLKILVLTTVTYSYYSLQFILLSHSHMHHWCVMNPTECELVNATNVTFSKIVTRLQESIKLVAKLQLN